MGEIKITPSEIHFIIRQLAAREEWIKDNPDEESIEENELYNVKSALVKLKEIKLIIKEEDT